jgi:hypothetical protein
MSTLHGRDDPIASVLMTDPAIAYAPRGGYGIYDRGTQLDLWLKAPDGNASFGVVWPGKFRASFGVKRNDDKLYFSRCHRLPR